MPRRKPPAKWVLPTEVDPAERLCIMVPVPNDPYHMAAFQGALLALQSAYNWADDLDHTAREVALVWRDIIDNLEWGCDVRTLLRMSADCEWIQYSYDNGVSWSNLVNVHSCASAAITEAINDGIIGVPNQQPPGGSVLPQECWSFNVQLSGNGIWHCPVPIAGNYSITVTPAVGGWWDGDINDLIWSCPTGADYALGACVGSPEPAQEGDPLQAAPHMRIIGHYGSVWFDAYDTEHDVDISQVETDFFLQANDSNLSDNQGSVTCKVTVCNYSTWCYTWDFTVSNGGWSGVTYYDCVPEYVASTGWRVIKTRTDPDGINIFDCITKEFPQSARITDCAIHYEVSNCNGNTTKQIGVICFGDVAGSGGYAVTPERTAPQDIEDDTASFDKTDDQVWIRAQGYGGNAGPYGCTIVIKNVTLRGSGMNPFGADNCEA